MNKYQNPKLFFSLSTGNYFNNTGSTENTNEDFSISPMDVEERIKLLHVCHTGLGDSEHAFRFHHEGLQGWVS